MIKQLLFKKQAPDLATPESLEVLEQKLKLRLPPALAEFCSRWNGGFPSKENKFYPVPPTFNEYYGEYEKSKGFYTDTLFGATDTLLNCSLLKECALIGEYSNYVIPITVDLFGNRAVLKLDSLVGMVYWWDHELWDTVDDPNEPGKTIDWPRLFPIARDLESFYNSLTFAPDKH